MTSIAKWMIVSICAIVFLIIFTLYYLPLDTIVKHYLGEVERQTNAEFKVEVGAVDASLLFKSKFKKFRLFKRNPQSKKYELVFTAPEVALSTSYLGLLWNDFEFDFEVKGKRGFIEGQLEFDEQNRWNIDLELKNLSTRLVPYLENQLMLTGQLSGFVNLYWDQNNLAANRGDIQLKTEDLKMKGLNPEVSEAIKQLNLGLDLGPNTQIPLAQKKAPTQLIVRVKGHRVYIDQFKLNNPNFLLDLKGRIALISKNFMGSILDVKGTLIIAEDARQKAKDLFAVIGQVEGIDQGRVAIEVRGPIMPDQKRKSRRRYRRLRLKLGNLDLASLIKGL